MFMEPGNVLVPLKKKVPVPVFTRPAVPLPLMVPLKVVAADLGRETA